MKKNVVKRVLAVAFSAVLAMSALAGCTKGGKDSTESGVVESTVEVPEGKGGTIMWLSNLSSGIQYDTSVAYLETLCEKLGYEFVIVYGDTFNDPAANLQAVKNGMTDDVVGIIASQDGGLLSIMDEYPDVYVAGYNTDMVSVYDEGGANAGCLDKDHFLGTICDGSADGANMAQTFFDTVVDKGYKDIAVINFPEFAYPNQGVAAKVFKDLVDEYNDEASADEKINIVGDTTTLMFEPLPESWFLEEGKADLDCIVSMCAGFEFVYPTMVSAMGNGTCSADTKLITGGFNDDADIVSAIGDAEDGKIITMFYVSPAEDPAYALILLDNAINGKQYEDFKADRVDSFVYKVDSTADIDNVMDKSMFGTANVGLAQITVDDVLNLCTRVNPDATYADLVDMFHNADKISVDALAK